MNADLAAFLQARYAEEDAAGPPDRAGRERRASLARYLDGAADRHGPHRGMGEGLLEVGIRLFAAEHAQHPEYLADWAPEAMVPIPEPRRHHDILARAVRAQDGLWDTGRAVTALRDAGVPVGEGDRADEKQARDALRKLLKAGLLVYVDSQGNTAVYRRPE